MPVYKLSRIPEGASIEFCSLRGELTEFFQVERLEYEAQLLVVTYGLYRDDSLVAMFSLCNDSIPISEVSKVKGEKFLRGKDYPAVRIIAFSVKAELIKGGIGTALISFLQPFFIIGNKTGCRFIIVNAYNDYDNILPSGKVVKFYREKGNFKPYIYKKDPRNVTTPMFCDLSRIKQALMEVPELVEYWQTKVDEMTRTGSVIIDLPEAERDSQRPFT